MCWHCCHFYRIPQARRGFQAELLPSIRDQNATSSDCRRAHPFSLGQDIEPAFRRGASLGAQAYVVTDGPLLSRSRKAIADRMVRAKVPSILGNSQYVESGGLMSYSPSHVDNFRRAAGYVDKIFKGARPADLPVEQPTKFELFVNRKTAKALGLAIPQSLLLQADKVIE